MSMMKKIKASEEFLLLRVGAAEAGDASVKFHTFHFFLKCERLKP